MSIDRQNERGFGFLSMGRVFLHRQQRQHADAGHARQVVAYILQTVVGGQPGGNVGRKRSAQDGR